MSYKLCVFVLLGCVLYVQEGQYHSLTTSERYAVVGSPFTFTCQGNCYPDIIWSMDTTEYRMNRGYTDGHCYFRSKIPEEYIFNCSVAINTLTIKAVKLSQHRTVWKCGDDGGQSNEIKLEVREGPGTSLKLNTSSVVTVVEGSDVTVDCSATCFITCKYQWKRVDDVISNTGILSLANIKISQSGFYVCTAENPDTKQTANRKLHLIVQCPVQDSSQFWKGFFTCFGICLLLVIVTAAVIYVHRKRNKQTAEADDHYDSDDNFLDEIKAERERTDVDE